MPADSLCFCRLERFTRRILPPTKKLASASTAIRISSTPSNADGTRLYPVMPFPSYTGMTDADVLAIKAYLFNLPAVHAENQPTTFGFPYNQRWLMGIWSTFFNEDERFRPNPSQSAEWNRAPISPRRWRIAASVTPRAISRWHSTTEINLPAR